MCLEPAVERVLQRLAEGQFVRLPAGLLALVPDAQMGHFGKNRCKNSSTAGLVCRVGLWQFIIRGTF